MIFSHRRRAAAIDEIPELNGRDGGHCDVDANEEGDIRSNASLGGTSCFRRARRRAPIRFGAYVVMTIRAPDDRRLRACSAEVVILENTDGTPPECRR
jgi:hypothetical protein